MDADKIQIKLGVNKEKLSLDNAVKTFEDKVIYRPFTQFYKNITSTHNHVAPAKFDATIMVLRKNGYEQLADQYEKVGKSAIKNIDGKEFLDLGSRDKMFKVFGKDVSVKPFVNFIIAPFKFIWNTVTLPYWMVDEKLLNLFRKTPKN